MTMEENHHQNQAYQIGRTGAASNINDSGGNPILDTDDLRRERERILHERKELEEEKKKVLEMKNFVDKGKEKLRREIENMDAVKRKLMDQMKVQGIGTLDDSRLQAEKDKINLRWEQLSEDEKKITADREKLDVLFEDISKRKFALDVEIRKVDETKERLDKKNDELRELELKLDTERSKLDEEKANWKEEYAEQLAEMKALPDLKAEIELDKSNIRIEKMRLEEERKIFDEEKRSFEVRKRILDEEQKILEEQRKLIDEQKKRLLENEGLSIEGKYALETPIPKTKEPIRTSAAISGTETKSKVFDIGTERLSRPRFDENITDEVRKRRERLNAMEKRLHPGSRDKSDRGTEEKDGPKPEVPKLPTMTCISCDTPIPIPPDSELVSCPGCGRDYKIKRRTQPRTEEKKTVQERSTKSPVRRSTPIDQPIAATSVMPEGGRQEARIEERNGNYYVKCTYAGCGNEIQIPNTNKRRVHCTRCSRRIKIAPWEA